MKKAWIAASPTPFQTIMPQIPPPTDLATPHRFVNRDGKVNIRRQGFQHYHHPRDAYHWLMEQSWPRLVAWISLTYILLNALFAVLYMLQPGSITRATAGDFLAHFFFSVQTLATVGYGEMHPATTYGNLVVALESLLGMASIAIITGIVFTRFSRPTARVVFSTNAVVAPFDGLPTLMFRAANQRGNQLLQAEVKVTLARSEQTLEGESLRRFYDLKLVRNATSMFSLTWTVRHQIDASSPLYNITSEQLRNSEAEIIVLLSGIDDVFGETVHARHAYYADEILCNHRFVDMFARDADNHPIIDYAHFNKVEPLAKTAEDGGGI